LVRVTTAEVTLSGTTIPAGAMVLALLASANRDEKRYSNPDEFVLERQQASVSFGHGIHFCIGAQLARMEGRLALEALLTRLKRFTRVPGEVTWSMSTPVTRGPVKLPFRFEA
jgi:cytochrome P450